MNPSTTKMFKAVPSFVGHQSKYSHKTDKGQSWINKPHILYTPRLQIGHFATVAFDTFVVILGTLIVGGILGDVSVSPNPDGVGRNAILACLAHAILLYYVFNTRALEKLDIRVNPYITLADCFLHRAIGVVPCIIEVVAQCVGAVAATAVVYGMIQNTPAIAAGVGGTIINTSTGWAFGISIISGTVIGWSYFHNWRTETNAQQMAHAVAIAVLISYAFVGPTTHNPLRWLGACIIEGTCDNSGSWIYPVGPAIGVVIAYLLHLVTWKIEPKDGENLE